MQTMAFSQASWLNFVRSVPNQKTLESYVGDVIKYMEYLGLDDPDKLLIGSPKELEDKVMAYIEKRKGSGASSFSISRGCFAIKKFYDRNRVALSWPFILDTIGKSKRKQKDEAYSRGNIQKILAISDYRERAIILLLSSTGIRSGSIPELKYGDLTPIDKYGIFKITVYSGYEEEYYTFCTPECRSALEDYFQYRRQAGEIIGKHSPILRDMFDHKMRGRVVEATPMSKSNVYFLLDNLVQKAGLRRRVPGTESRGVRHEFKLLHGFRKFFDTQCTNAGMNPLWVEILEGHDIKLKEAYFRPSEDDLLEGSDKMIGYAGVINNLTINDEYRLKTQLKKTEAERDNLIALYEQELAKVWTELRKFTTSSG